MEIKVIEIEEIKSRLLVRTFFRFDGIKNRVKEKMVRVRCPGTVWRSPGEVTGEKGERWKPRCCELTYKWDYQWWHWNSGLEGGWVIPKKMHYLETECGMEYDTSSRRIAKDMISMAANLHFNWRQLQNAIYLEWAQWQQYGWKANCRLISKLKFRSIFTSYMFWVNKNNKVF